MIPGRKINIWSLLVRRLRSVLWFIRFYHKTVYGILLGVLLLCLCSRFALLCFNMPDRKEVCLPVYPACDMMSFSRVFCSGFCPVGFFLLFRFIICLKVVVLDVLSGSGKYTASTSVFNHWQIINWSSLFNNKSRIDEGPIGASGWYDMIDIYLFCSWYLEIVDIKCMTTGLIIISSHRPSVEYSDIKPAC